jgi:transketolase
MKDKIREEEHQKKKLQSQVKVWIILIKQRKVLSHVSQEHKDKLDLKRILEKKMLLKCRILFLWRRYIKKKGENIAIRHLSDIIQ